MEDMDLVVLPQQRRVDINPLNPNFAAGKAKQDALSEPCETADYTDSADDGLKILGSRSPRNPQMTQIDADRRQRESQYCISGSTNHNVSATNSMH